MLPYSAPTVVLLSAPTAEDLTARLLVLLLVDYEVKPISSR
jgi:hypothetical protein